MVERYKGMVRAQRQGARLEAGAGASSPIRSQGSQGALRPDNIECDTRPSAIRALVPLQRRDLRHLTVKMTKAIVDPSPMMKEEKVPLDVWSGPARFRGRKCLLLGSAEAPAAPAAG